MEIILGILIGLCFSGSIEIIAFHLLEKDKKRRLEEEERIRILENQLHVVAEKCDRTQKACRILSDIVKNNCKTEGKEEYKVQSDKLPHSVAEKVDRFNMTQCILSDEDIMNIYPDFGQSLISVLSQQVEDSVSRNMALMQSCCSAQREDVQKILFHALYPGWRLPDDPD